MVDGESQLPQTVLRPPHTCCGMCVSPPNEISKVGEEFSVSPLGRAQLERSSPGQKVSHKVQLRGSICEHFINEQKKQSPTDTMPTGSPKPQEPSGAGQSIEKIGKQTLQRG